MVSTDRIHQLLGSVFQVSISTGAIQNWVKQLAASAEAAVEKIREYVSKLRRIHCDETGLRVQKSLKWMHCIDYFEAVRAALTGNALKVVEQWG